MVGSTINLLLHFKKYNALRQIFVARCNRKVFNFLKKLNIDPKYFFTTILPSMSLSSSSSDSPPNPKLNSAISNHHLFFSLYNSKKLNLPLRDKGHLMNNLNRSTLVTTMKDTSPRSTFFFSCPANRKSPNLKSFYLNYAPSKKNRISNSHHSSVYSCPLETYIQHVNEDHSCAQHIFFRLLPHVKTVHMAQLSMALTAPLEESITRLFSNMISFETTTRWEWGKK